MKSCHEQTLTIICNNYGTEVASSGALSIIWCSYSWLLMENTLRDVKLMSNVFCYFEFIKFASGMMKFRWKSFHKSQNNTEKKKESRSMVPSLGSNHCYKNRVFGRCKTPTKDEYYVTNLWPKLPFLREFLPQSCDTVLDILGKNRSLEIFRLC